MDLAFALLITKVPILDISKEYDEHKKVVLVIAGLLVLLSIVGWVLVHSNEKKWDGYIGIGKECYSINFICKPGTDYFRDEVGMWL